MGRGDEREGRQAGNQVRNTYTKKKEEIEKFQHPTLPDPTARKMTQEIKFPKGSNVPKVTGAVPHLQTRSLV